MSLISCNGISKIYKMGEVEIKALKNISLEIHKSQFVSFIGPSGSGKTTILNLFGVLDKPTFGSVKVNGTDISKNIEKLFNDIHDD